MRRRGGHRAGWDRITRRDPGPRAIAPREADASACFEGSEVASGCLRRATDGGETCWSGFEACYDAAYGGAGGGDDVPPDDHGEAVESPCEAEIQACDDAGGSNTECLEVLGTCLEAAGVPADDPYLVCLGALTGCVGPAEASDDPDTALTDCAEAFNVCVGRG